MSAWRFGIFEVDVRSGELRRQGFKIKLQEQPFQVLLMLLEHPNEVITREELQKRLWAAHTFVDFERGLNRAINKLREALADTAESPRFIETVPRRGYRFLAAVETNTSAGDSPTLVEAVPAAAPTTRPVAAWTVAAVFALLALLAFGRPWRKSAGAADRPLLHVELDADPDDFSQPAISADGMRIVFVSKGSLAMRRLDQTRITRIAGTEGAVLPFFSPNGQWVAFFADGKLQKVAVEGGVPITLCETPHGGGGSWGDDENLVVASGDGLSLVPASGGTARPLTRSKDDPAGPRMQVSPQALPGGQAVLFASVSGSSQGSIQILNRQNGKLKTLVENATLARYLAGGYLVYYQRGTLFAAPMDLGRLALIGPPMPLVNGVANVEGHPEFDSSASGTLLYRGGTEGSNVFSWLDASGRFEPLIREPGHYITPRLSPDGTRLALALSEGGQQNIWVYNIERETWTRLTFNAGPDLLPTWTPDGEFLAFRSGNSLAWTRSDGSGKVEHLAGVGPNAGPWSFSTDGKWLAFWPLQPDSDLWVAPVERAPSELRLGRPQTLLEQPASKGAPAISPDGRWFAYTSNESGRFEVYVRPFLPPQNEKRGKWPVSTGGGWSPVWSRDGRRLFYESPERRVMVADSAAKGDSFVAAKPRAWSAVRLGDTGLFSGFSPAPDGRRVLVLLAAEDAKPQPFFHLLLNVDSELRRRVAARRP